MIKSRYSRGKIRHEFRALLSMGGCQSMFAARCWAVTVTRFSSASSSPSSDAVDNLGPSGEAVGRAGPSGDAVDDTGTIV